MFEKIPCAKRGPSGCNTKPLFLSVYFDTLLCRLSSTGIGCHMGSLFFGALAYADDLVLMEPSSNAMRRMLQICDEYAAHGIAKQVSRSGLTVLHWVSSY